MDRRSVLDNINQAKWNHNAKEIVRILQTPEIHLLQTEDIHDLYVNTLQRAANDTFSQDLFALKAFDIFHQVFLNYKK